VASITLSRGKDVGGGLAGRRGAVVACRTGAGDATVVEANGCPGGRHVTVVARITGREMTRGLAGGDGAVVAAEAGADHRGVVDA